MFELLCTFAVIDALDECGWQTRPLGLFHGQLRLVAHRGKERLDLWYQMTPRALKASSRYSDVLREHGFANPGGLRPDMVLREQAAVGNDGF